MQPCIPSNTSRLAGTDRVIFAVQILRDLWVMDSFLRGEPDPEVPLFKGDLGGSLGFSPRSRLVYTR
jgi:hypothetical protein